MLVARGEVEVELEPELVGAVLDEPGAELVVDAVELPLALEPPVEAGAEVPELVGAAVRVTPC